MASGTPNPQDTKTINDCIRAEYEAEVANISESDDPLDVFDRYVRWTLDAYPSAQATPQSQLHTLLERATKSFVSFPQYKNDPRYLKLWLHYIHFFSDAPRETFVFLSRHSIGETLALFYEEYAAWLEGAGRWAQAEEVYKLGIEREARPPQRLVRKFGEFEQRRAVQQPDGDDAPSSPALPTVRPALAAKIDPFAAAAAPRDPQAARPNHGVGGQASKPSRSKLTIFSDAGHGSPGIVLRRSRFKGLGEHWVAGRSQEGERDGAQALGWGNIEGGRQEDRCIQDGRLQGYGKLSLAPTSPDPSKLEC